MTDPERLPGARDVRVSFDGDGSDHVVVACPPHPQMGGDRQDARLRAVSDALTDAGVDCLRIDYGAWDEGVGERTDALTALAWADDRYDRVGLFGYSFGGAIALLAGAAVEPERKPEAISALAPASALSADLDAADALEDISVPVQVVYGERDDTVDWKRVVERAEAMGHEVQAVPADHFFVGQTGRVGDLISDFLLGGFE